MLTTTAILLSRLALIFTGDAALNDELSTSRDGERSRIGYITHKSNNCLETSIQMSPAATFVNLTLANCQAKQPLSVRASTENLHNSAWIQYNNGYIIPLAGLDKRITETNRRWHIFALTTYLRKEYGGKEPFEKCFGDGCLEDPSWRRFIGFAMLGGEDISRKFHIDSQNHLAACLTPACKSTDSLYLFGSGDGLVYQHKMDLEGLVKSPPRFQNCAREPTELTWEDIPLNVDDVARLESKFHKPSELGF
jgi:hypothetical protein